VTTRQDPYRSYNFLVEIDGITRAGFQECSGLDSTQDPIEYREGNEGLTVRKLPGLNTFSNMS
jgi:phage tail-like protein